MDLLTLPLDLEVLKANLVIKGGDNFEKAALDATEYAHVVEACIW